MPRQAPATRRQLTLLIAVAAIAAAVVAAALLPVPYVILSPGPTLNTLGTRSGKPLIVISGHRSYPTNGHLNMVTVSYQGGPSDGFNLFTAKVDGTDVRQLTQGAGNNEDPSWAPDGRYLVFTSSRSGRKKLFVTDAAGASQVQLTHGGGDDSSPTWSRWLE